VIADGRWIRQRQAPPLAEGCRCAGSVGVMERMIG
jgi:hypothetical protein